MILFTEQEIKNKVGEIAFKLKKNHHDLPPVFICVLNGAFMFFTDLVKHMGDCEIDFINAKSYQGTKQGEITIIDSIKADIEGAQRWKMKRFLMIAASCAILFRPSKQWTKNQKNRRKDYLILWLNTQLMKLNKLLITDSNQPQPSSELPKESGLKSRPRLANSLTDLPLSVFYAN